MNTLLVELIEETEKGVFGVAVEEGLFVGVGLSAPGKKLAGVPVGGGVREAAKVPVAGTNTVGVAVQVGFN